VHLNYRLVEKFIITRIAPTPLTRTAWSEVPLRGTGFEKAWTTVTKVRSLNHTRLMRKILKNLLKPLPHFFNMNFGGAKMEKLYFM